MNTAVKSKSAADVDYFIDITAEVCPLTFVKTKLLIERMRPGEVAEVRLKGQEPLENVPRDKAKKRALLAERAMGEMAVFVRAIEAG